MLVSFVCVKHCKCGSSVDQINSNHNTGEDRSVAAVSAAAFKTLMSMLCVFRSRIAVVCLQTLQLKLGKQH